MWPKYLSHVEISIACLPSAPPTGEGVNLSVDIHFLAQGLEKNDILFVGKEVQQPKQFPWMERRWVLLKIPRCDIDGVGEGK